MGPPTTPAAQIPPGKRRSGLDGQAGEDWKFLHRLCRRLTKAPTPMCLLFDKTGMCRYAKKDRVKILAEHLEEQFTLHPASESHVATSHREEMENRVREFLLAPVLPLPGNYYVFLAETASTILRLPKRKALGPDGILIIAIKQLLRRAMASKDPRLASNQSLITLFSHVTKLLERIVLRHLHCHLTPRQEQFGFRCGHSITFQPARVLHHMAAEHNRGRRTVGIFLDIEKAFDRTIASYLEVRSFYVTVEDATSDPLPNCTGVPQGSCLLPCLYAVFTNDIPTLEGQLLAGQMACRRECDEDGRLIDRPTAYRATEVETPKTRSGMVDQGEISGCADRSLHAHGHSGGACYPPEQSRAEHTTPSTSIVRALPHITEEEDPKPTKRRLTDNCNRVIVVSGSPLMAEKDTGLLSVKQLVTV
ncbi:RNA-directed DNA polymerase from mobile element jockey [Eumeta japonica]|uniref:RNA-directed DNA polymerase from mobile element jockey n=1 Tax=Eumeta variegata TaxID=151549 RepID=A0A4C1Z2R2_EUMVA|nr:RNA-directed DNA polymerase from mobile element jockey [Eumeta japonica]